VGCRLSGRRCVALSVVPACNDLDDQLLEAIMPAGVWLAQRVRGRPGLRHGSHLWGRRWGARLNCRESVGAASALLQH